MTAVCICGEGTECTGQCAGAIAQRLECAELGHLTMEAMHRRAWREEPEPNRFLGFCPPGFCYRCGETAASSQVPA